MRRFGASPSLHFEINGGRASANDLLQSIHFPEDGSTSLDICGSPTVCQARIFLSTQSVDVVVVVQALPNVVLDDVVFITGDFAETLGLKRVYGIRVEVLVSSSFPNVFVSSGCAVSVVQIIRHQFLVSEQKDGGKRSSFVETAYVACAV